MHCTFLMFAKSKPFSIIWTIELGGSWYKVLRERVLEGARDRRTAKDFSWGCPVQVKPGWSGMYGMPPISPLPGKEGVAPSVTGGPGQLNSQAVQTEEQSNYLDHVWKSGESQLARHFPGKRRRGKGWRPMYYWARAARQAACLTLPVAWACDLPVDSSNHWGGAFPEAHPSGPVNEWVCIMVSSPIL